MVNQRTTKKLHKTYHAQEYKQRHQTVVHQNFVSDNLNGSNSVWGMKMLGRSFFLLVNRLIEIPLHIVQIFPEGFINSFPQLNHLIIMSLMIFNTWFLLLFKGFKILPAWEFSFVVEVIVSLLCFFLASKENSSPSTLVDNVEGGHESSPSLGKPFAEWTFSQRVYISS